MKRWCALLLAYFAAGAWAEVVIDRTRLIYPATQREVTVHLTNQATGPRLVQVWMDSGDAQVRPEFVDVPFSVTPPILRMEAAQRASLRVFLQAVDGQREASDREAVYWLNVLGIAPSPVEGGQASVRLAIRSRIKVFLRPKGLAGDAASAPQALRWRLLDTSSGELEVHNPTGFYLSLSRVALTRAGIRRHSQDPPMLAPLTTTRLSLSETLPARVGPASISFTTLDDYGIPRHHTQPLP